MRTTVILLVILIQSVYATESIKKFSCELSAKEEAGAIEFQLKNFGTEQEEFIYRMHQEYEIEVPFWTSSDDDFLNGLSDTLSGQGGDLVRLDGDLRFF
ncbi:MAG: hypothetical protein HOE90_02420 [Bacteriovoracaceae bacterium]|nr:hypothetical protein [Bacteriovoracaceae bacterium]